MFKVDDKVISKDNPGFWYTITEVLAAGYYRVKEGMIGPDAGVLHESDLTPYTLGE